MALSLLLARFARAALLDAEKTQEEAKEESFRRREPRSAPLESAAKAGSSPQGALVLSASIWFLLGFSVFQKLGLLSFGEGNAATSGETETQIADTAETRTSCGIRYTLP